MTELSTNLKSGLTQKEAEERIKKYGYNQLEKEEDESLWERIKESFDDLLVKILLLAATVSFIIALIGKKNEESNLYIGDGEEGMAAYVEPFVILLILIANSVIAIW